MKYLSIIIATFILCASAHGASLFGYSGYDLFKPGSVDLLTIVYIITAVLLVTILVVSYYVNKMCLRKLQYPLSSDQQATVAKLDTPREQMNQVYKAVREGLLFLPEIFLMLAAIIALITMIFLAFNFKIMIDADTVKYVYLFYLCILASAILLQIWIVVRRFIHSKRHLNEELHKLSLPEDYIQKRTRYSVVFNIILFALGDMIWMPLIISYILMPQILTTLFQVYFFEILILTFIMCVILRALRI